jgi:SHS2 domain-containing protein
VSRLARGDRPEAKGVGSRFRATTNQYGTQVARKRLPTPSAQHLVPLACLKFLSTPPIWDYGFARRIERVLFVESARALFSVLAANLDSVRCVEQRTYEIQGDADDYLLFDWLNELLYTYDTQRLLLAQFDVQLDKDRLRAVCRGEPADRTRHDLDHEIKAITYHGLRVERDETGWLAEVIVDI